MTREEFDAANAAVRHFIHRARVLNSLNLCLSMGMMACAALRWAPGLWIAVATLAISQSVYVWLEHEIDQRQKAILTQLQNDIEELDRQHLNQVETLHS